MRDTDSRLKLCLHRAAALRRKRENRITAALSGACAVLFICLAGMTKALGGVPRGSVPDFYGATMLLEGAGGYVFIGVLAFMAGMVITVLCVRHREKEKKIHDKTEDDKK